jgi:hypothetical protein
MPIDTIEDRELDPWEEYTMTKKDSIVFKQLAGYYFVPRAAGINLKFNNSDGTCQFHDLDEKLQLCIYQVKNDQILLFASNDTNKYVFLLLVNSFLGFFYGDFFTWVKDIRNF